MIQYTKYQSPLHEDLHSKIVEDLNYFSNLFYRNQLENPSDTNHKLIVQFSTTGGELAIADCIVDLFNDFNNRFKLSLVGFRDMSSAGFFLFRDFLGEKKLLPNVISVLHLPTIDSTLRNLRNKKSIESVILKDLEKDYDMFITSIPGLTKAEQDMLKNGEDVTLVYSRLKKIFKCK